MSKSTVQIFAILIISSLSFIACSSSDKVSNKTHYGIFKVMDNNESIEMNGVINSNSLKNFNALHKAYPDIKKIVIKECEGSEDDETNLKLSLKVHQIGFEIHINNGGLVASGGTDFFLAGIKRTVGVDTRIGVHSWGGENDNGKEVTATDFPKGHEHHLPYIKYYKNIGFTQEEAEEFYYFTINAASANDIHWMTKEELSKYKVLKE